MDSTRMLSIMYVALHPRGRLVNSLPSPRFLQSLVGLCCTPLLIRFFSSSFFVRSTPTVFYRAPKSIILSYSLQDGPGTHNALSLLVIVVSTKIIEKRSLIHHSLACHVHFTKIYADLFMFTVLVTVFFEYWSRSMCEKKC
jgi:hypothetical protein